MVLIILVSHQPSESIPEYGPWDPFIKKGGHLLAYGILAVLMRWAGFNTMSSIVLVLTFAASDELHQRFVPGRNGTAEDVLIDFTGAMTALLLLRLLSRPWRVFRWGRTNRTDGQLPRDV